jgi:hypothetical protein
MLGPRCAYPQPTRPASVTVWTTLLHIWQDSAPCSSQSRTVSKPLPDPIATRSNFLRTICRHRSSSNPTGGGLRANESGRMGDSPESRPLRIGATQSQACAIEPVTEGCGTRVLRNSTSGNRSELGCLGVSGLRHSLVRWSWCARPGAHRVRFLVEIPYLPPCGRVT